MVDCKTLMDKYEKGTCDIQPFVQPCKIHFFHKAIFLLSYYLQWNYMLEVQLYWKLICILRLHFSRIKACFWERIGANIKKLFFAEVKDCSFESQRLQRYFIKLLKKTVVFTSPKTTDFKIHAVKLLNNYCVRFDFAS